MKLCDSDKIARLYSVIKRQPNYSRKDICKILTSKSSAQLMEEVYRECEWETLVDNKVFILHNKGEKCVVKKITIEDDLYSENQCEIIANIILTTEQPTAAVKLINMAMWNDRLYLFFEYMQDGTLHSYTTKKNRRGMTNEVLLNLFEAGIDALNSVHMNNTWKIQHFDCRSDNIYVDSMWEDINEPITESDVVIDYPNDDELSVVVGDFGLCELNVTKNHRLINKQIPREKSAEKKWGVYALAHKPSYDFLYYIETFVDDLDILKRRYLMRPIWKEIEKRYPSFNHRTFFNDEGRMYSFIELSYTELKEIIADVRSRYSEYLTK